jgi:hypothetical protein
MKLSRALIIVLAIVLYQSITNHECCATNWQFVTAWKNKQMHYIDHDSIQVNTEKKEITFITKTEQPSGYYDTMLVVCNYAEKYYKPIKVIQYDDNGNIVKSITNDPVKSDKKFIPVVSAMEVILNEALSIKGIKTNK